MAKQDKQAHLPRHGAARREMEAASRTAPQPTAHREAIRRGGAHLRWGTLRLCNDILGAEINSVQSENIV